jgi:hypothetical protein
MISSAEFGSAMRGLMRISAATGMTENYKTISCRETIRQAYLGWSPVSSASGVDVARTAMRRVSRDHAPRTER